MATLAQIEKALHNAHNAGDEEAARHLAGVYKQMRGEKDKQVENESTGLSHKIQVSGRGIIEGISAIPGQLYNASQMVPQAIAQKIEEKTGFRHPFLDSGLALPAEVDTEQLGGKLATGMGLDKPTEQDNIIYPVSKAVGGYVIPATGMAKFGSGAIKAGGAALGGDIPLTSIAGITAGKTAAEIARQNNASPNQQLLADIAGNLGSGAALGVANAVGRTASRAGKAAVGGGLEAVAGRTLNRAAGQESPQIVETLATGAVPNLKALKGYKPTASEIAGNPGLSTIMRQTGMDVDSLSALGARKFENAKALESYISKIAGSPEKLAKMKDQGFAAIDEVTLPMRQRNLPVDTTNVKAAIDSAIAKHTGNKAITKTLESLKKDIPESSSFNSVYNFKQYIDETLRGNPMSDPKVASMQRAASALGSVKKELADALEATEPGFKDYLKFQAKNLQKIGNREAGASIVEKSRLSNPLVSNLSGQEEVFPISSNKLKSALMNEKTMKKLSPAQKGIIETTEKYSRLPARSNLGMMANSNTAQNLNVKEAVFNDLMAAGFGEKPNVLGRAAKTGMRLGSNLLSPILGKVSSENSAALAQILTKAELNPKYAAELMKVYGLGNLNFNDTAGRAALRSILTDQGKTQ